jgi:hypothetical protein
MNEIVKYAVYGSSMIGFITIITEFLKVIKL